MLHSDVKTSETIFYKMAVCLYVLLFSGIQSIAFARSTSESEPRRSVTVQGTSKVFGDRFSAENYPSRVGHAFLGLRYGIAQRFEETRWKAVFNKRGIDTHRDDAPSVVNDDFTYLDNASRPYRGNACPQIQEQIPGPHSEPLSMDEDCLYLDMYVPAFVQKNTTKLPVMLYIHGGGFAWGNKNMYNGSQLALAIDVVVISINYRLGVLGFLSTKSGTNTGNYGLGDAKTALKWTKKYIHKFGGDPNAVTIFGQSAGAAMVSALFLDEAVRTSVRAAIAMSGSITAKWTMAYEPFQYAQQLATAAGCQEFSDAQSVLACLGSLSVSDILNSSSNLAPFPPMMGRFQPTLDGLHLKDDPVNSIANGNTNFQKATFVESYLAEDFALVLDWTEPDFFNTSAIFDFDSFKEHVTRWLISITASFEPRPDLVDLVVAFYNVAETDSPEVLPKKFIRIVTDGFFGYPASKESFLYAQWKHTAHTPNQLFRVSYDPGYKKLGAFHTLDAIYVFGHPIYGIDLRDETISRRLREVLRQVAYNGRMSGPDFGPEGAYTELGQNKTWKRGTQKLKPMVDFWDDLTARVRNEQATTEPAK